MVGTTGVAGSGPPALCRWFVDQDAVGMEHDALAADGAIVRIRTVAPSDRDDLAALYRRTSDENLYRRFLSAGRRGIDQEVDRLTRPDAEDHVALLAQERGRVVGVAAYERLPDRQSAEFAVLVDDAAHGRGIGTLLLEELAAIAHRHGIGDLVGEVLTGNVPMLAVARDLGPALDMRRDGGVLEVHVRTDDRDNPALEARNRSAERYSLTPLLQPRAIAVIGAGRQPAGIGHAVLRGLLDGGFTGPVHPINPNATEIAGRPAYPSVQAVGEPGDLAVGAGPGPARLGAPGDCGEAGVPAPGVLPPRPGGPGGRGGDAARA